MTVSAATVADVIAQIEMNPALRAQVKANAQEAYDDWDARLDPAPPPYGWVGGRVRDALNFATDLALGTSETVAGDPTSELGQYFYPTAEGT